MRMALKQGPEHRTQKGPFNLDKVDKILILINNMEMNEAKSIGKTIAKLKNESKQPAVLQVYPNTVLNPTLAAYDFVDKGELSWNGKLKSIPVSVSAVNYDLAIILGDNTENLLLRSLCKLVNAKYRVSNLRYDDLKCDMILGDQSLTNQSECLNRILSILKNLSPNYSVAEV